MSSVFSLDRAADGATQCPAERVLKTRALKSHKIHSPKPAPLLVAILLAPSATISGPQLIRSQLELSNMGPKAIETVKTASTLGTGESNT